MQESQTGAVARALGRYYQAENDGAADAYAERASASGFTPGETERCRLPNGTSSMRPTVLANPPVSPSAVRQREALFAALGTYSTTLGAVAGGSGPDTISASLGNLKSRTVELQKAAGEHEQGDLFLEDATAALRTAVNAFEKGDDRSRLTQQFATARAAVQHLSAILATDIAQQRVDTIDATALAYDAWLSRNGGTAGATNASRERGSPFCSEPAIFDRSHSRAVLSKDSAPSNPRGAALRDRMIAARAVDPGSVLNAMIALNDKEMRLLDDPGQAGVATDVTAARDGLKRVAAHFVQASFALDPVTQSGTAGKTLRR